MGKNLWELRKQRNLTVKQLAAKSGVPAKNIYAYEAGELVKMADLERLAKVLFVNNAEIKLQSDPIPKTKPEPPPKPPKPAPAPKPQPAAAAQKPAAPSPPATPGQLAQLRTLLQGLGLEETAVASRIEKPLDKLNLQEARSWIRTLEIEGKAAKVQAFGERPPDTRRKRALPPEGVDEFEGNYLLARQAAGDQIVFTLLDETILTGRIIGFGPFNITIQQADGAETTIQKLALAYYHVASPTEVP